MRLDQLEELDKCANEIKEKVHYLQLQYLMHDRDYPYNKIKDLMDRYKVLYDKVHKRKFGVFLNKEIETSKFIKYNVNKILLGASQLTVPYMVDSFGVYYFDDDNDVQEVSLKFYPIVINLKLDEILSLYKILKKKICSLEGFNEFTESCLQEMFVGYIRAKISELRDCETTENNFRWDDKDICEVMLKEKILYRTDGKKECINKKKSLK